MLLNFFDGRTGHSKPSAMLYMVMGKSTGEEVSTPYECPVGDSCGNRQDGLLGAMLRASPKECVSCNALR